MNDIIFDINNINEFYEYLNNKIKKINYNKSYFKNKSNNKTIFINDLNLDLKINDEIYNLLQESLIKDINKNYTNKSLNINYYDYNYYLLKNKIYNENQTSFIKIILEYIFFYIKNFEYNKLNLFKNILFNYFGFIEIKDYENNFNKYIFLFNEKLFEDIFKLNLNLELFLNIDLENNIFIYFNFNDNKININKDELILQNIITLINDKQNLEFKINDIEEKYKDKIKSLKKQNEKLQNDINKYKSIIKSLQTTINDANNI